MTQNIDRLTQYLISNGDVPVVASQAIYEYAWGQGIRPLREDRLKPGNFRRGRKLHHKTARTRSAGAVRETELLSALADLISIREAY